jgi:hypothetical protein
MAIPWGMTRISATPKRGPARMNPKQSSGPSLCCREDAAGRDNDLAFVPADRRHHPSDESRPLVLAGVRWATRRRFDPRSSPSWKKNHIRNQFRITGSLGLIPFHDPEKPRCRISTGPTIPIIATRSIKFRTASPCEFCSWCALIRFQTLHSRSRLDTSDCCQSVSGGNRSSASR